MSKSIANQKQRTAPVVEMDAGKFLGRINSGAQSQVTLFEERVRKMGHEAGAQWRLVSLSSNNLMFEDIDQSKYYNADITRMRGNQVKIGNIKEIRVVEAKKEETFHKNVNDLVTAISEDDVKQADNIFSRIAAQRFRSKVIPESGAVTTRDGVTRQVSIAKQLVPSELKQRIIKAVCESLNDSIKVSRGRIVEATFGEKQFKFPVTELVRRRVVARNMKAIAEQAYMSEGFQNRIEHIASLVCENKLDKAVEVAAEFLNEEQEFSLLDLKETRELVGFALAAKGSLNEQLEKNVGELFYRTNCKINRPTILDEWRQTARMTEYAPLVENVRRLEASKDFEKDYQSFLKMVFTEDISTRQAKAKMYLSALKDMMNVLKGGPDPELVEGLEEYVLRLENQGDEVDDATLMEVEELVASTSENLLGDITSLKDYDTIPEPQTEEPPAFGDEDLGAEAGGELSAGGPALPLGGMGETEAAIPGEEEEGAEEEGVPEEEFGLPGEEEEEEELLAADVKKTGKVVSEGKCQKCGAEADVINERGMCTECSPAVECEAYAIGGVCVDQLREAVAKLAAEDLQSELDAWKNGASKYFEEDGQDPCAVQLRTYIEHANKIGAKEIAEAFGNILAENAVVMNEGEDVEIDSDPYSYDSQGVKINAGYTAEDHGQWKGKMKQSKEGGQIGGKETAQGQGDAMGSASEPTDMNVVKNGKGKLKKTASEGKIVCSECSGRYELCECMTQEGAVCPECGAPMAEQMMMALDEEISGAGHQMDRIDGDKGGVAATSLASSDGCGAGGSKQDMEKKGGSGVASQSLANSDGRSAQSGKGKKDEMEKGGGSTVKGGSGGQVKGLTEGDKSTKKKCDCPDGECDCEVDEDQYKDATRRRRMAQIGKGRSTLAQTESVSEDRTVVMVTDQPVDDVVANIASSMGPEMEPDELGDEELPGEDDDMMPPDEEELDIPPEGEGGEEFPPEGEDEGEFPPEGEGDEFPPEGEGEEDEGEGPPLPGEEEEDEEDELEEGTLPPALEKYKKKKGEDGGGESDDDSGSEDDDSSEGQKPWESVSEDNDITSPQGSGYTSEKDARNDGDGKSMKPKPKLKETDVAGRKNAGPARSAGD